MEIYWKDEKTRKLFESEEVLRASGFDKKERFKILEAMSNIDAVNSINELPHNMGCHPIKKGKKFLYFAVDIPSVGGGRGKNRILLFPQGDYDLSDLKTITKVEILGIGDYHK